MKPSKSKIAVLLAEAGIHRCAWRGLWPAIPVPLRHDEFDERALRDAPSRPVFNLEDGTSTLIAPPVVRPAWVERIQEWLLQEILPIKKGMTWGCYKAALAGYAFAGCEHEAQGRMKAAGGLVFQESDASESDKEERIAAHVATAVELRECRGRLSKEAMKKGFAYGVKCRQREKAWTPSAEIQSAQIYKAILLNWRHVHQLTSQKATAKEIGLYIAQRARMSSGKTYAEHFKRSGVTTYLKQFQKICGQFGIPLPSRGQYLRKTPAT
jgi:hypothetical protein